MKGSLVAPAVVIASIAAWQALLRTDGPEVARELQASETLSPRAMARVDNPTSLENAARTKPSNTSSTLVEAQLSRASPFNDRLSPPTTSKTNEAPLRQGSSEPTVKQTPVPTGGQRASASRPAAQACELSDFIRNADTIYELLPEEVITFKVGGDFLRLRELLALSVCPQGAIVDSPLAHDLAVLSAGVGLRVGVGSGWLSTTAGTSTLQGPDYAEISEIFTNRRLGPGPNQSRQGFENQMAEGMWLQP
jgi:hypothetical protein